MEGHNEDQATGYTGPRASVCPRSAVGRGHRRRISKPKSCWRTDQMAGSMNTAVSGSTSKSLVALFARMNRCALSCNRFRPQRRSLFPALVLDVGDLGVRPLPVERLAVLQAAA